MNTNELLTHLQTTYPNLEFGLDTPQGLGVTDVCSDDELKNVPEKIIYFVSPEHGTAMWDAYASECSRFMAAPTDYGISMEDGKLMLEHNKVSIHGVYGEVVSGKHKAPKP